MKLNLIREPSTPTCTFGRLTVDQDRAYYTLERPDVQIPPGTYSVEITYSPRFKLPLPLLDSVPGRTDIRIHMGNWPRDTEGCILVGMEKGPDMITHSRIALNSLVAQIEAALAAREPVSIVIS
jgi:hypothetical protein